MKSKKSFLWPGILLALALRLGSQEPLAVEHITANAIPLQMEIHCVFLGSGGFLWIGSQNGLARYDGYRVVPCRLDEAERPAGGDSSVRSIAEDKSGRLWLATARGLVRYDPGSGAAVRFRHESRWPDTISADDLTCLFISPAISGRLWVGSAGGDLDEFDLESGHVTRYPQDAAIASQPGRIHVISGDPAGFLWIGAARGLYRFLPLAGRLQFCPPLPDEAGTPKLAGIRSMLYEKGAEDSLWIGSDAGGLFRYFPASGSWHRCAFTAALNDMSTEAVINAVSPYPGAAGSLMLGTDEGLYRFDPDSGRCARLALVFNRVDIQYSRCTRALYLDRQGNCWIGTCQDGLDKWSPKRIAFHDYFPYKAPLPNPLANWVTSIQELENRVVLLTTYGGGAFFFNRQDNSFRRLLLDPARPGRMLNQFITDCLIDRDGLLWFTTKEGLARCSVAGRMQRLYPYGDSDKILVFLVAQDSRGEIWMATDRGVIRLDPETGSMRRYRHERLAPRSLSNDRVNFIVEEDGGPIWVGTDDGLNLFLPQQEGFTVFRNDPSDPASLSNNFVYYLKKDSMGRIWVCTGNGLNLVRRRDGRVFFQRFLVPGNDRDENFFLSQVEESSRFFWLGSKGGLARFDSERGTFTFYDRLDGVTADTLNEAYVGFRSRDGEFYFGGRWGFTCFRYNPLSLNLHPPPLVVTDLRIEQGFEGTTSSRVPGKKSVRVELAALDFVRPEKNQYAYRLEGRDPGWIYQGCNRVVRLEGLKPGNYMLRVIAANSDGIWNEQGETVPIVVRLPFWRPWRIALLTVLLLAGVVFYLVWIRRQRSRWMQHAALPENLDPILEKFAISKREAEIVRLLLAGKSNKEIEDQLFIAMATVKIHIHNIFRKIKVGNRMQLLLRIQQEAKKLK